MWIWPVVMPIVMLTVMLAALYLMFGRGGWRGPCGRDDAPPPRHNGETALDILKKRYARGEITKEEL